MPPSVFPRRVRFFVLVAALASLGLDFRGCSSGEGDPPEFEDGGRPLPRVDAGGGCLFDTDCPADACRAVRCVDGVCVVTSDWLVDADGDGFPPPPCGEDCDDNDPTVFPGAPELCDGKDNSCNGLIDDDAPPRSLGRVRLDLRSASLAALDETYLIVGLGASGVDAWRFDTEARFSSQVELGGCCPGAEGLSVAARDGGVELVYFTSSPASIVRRRVELRGGDLEVVGEPVVVPMPEAAEAHRFATTTLAGEAYFAIRAEPDDGARWVYAAGAGTLRQWVEASDAPYALGLAHDGSRLVLPVAEARLAFLPAEGEGEEAVIHPVVGPLARGPLVSGTGRVVAALRDAFDHILVGVERDLGSRRSVAAPGMVGDVFLGRYHDRVFVIRDGRAWLIERDLSSFVGSYPLGLAAPSAVELATIGDSYGAILLGGDGEAELELLGCPAPE